MHALIFDLDGTLVDSVYAHVLAWQGALDEAGLVVDGYRLHRHVGSSGKLIVRFAQRETGRELSMEQRETVHRRHEQLFRERLSRPRPLPGAIEILRALRARKFRTPSPQPVTGRSSTLRWKPSTSGRRL